MRIGLCGCLLGLALLLPVVDLRADDLIRSVQKKLTALGFYKGKVDGASGSMTNAAIRRFQLAQNLKVTGELNSQTLAKLGLEGRVPAPDYSAIGRFFAGGPLARAEVNSQVETLRQIQGKLAAEGFYAGPHHGMPNSTLVAALKEWQNANGLDSTGRIDSATAEKMKLNR
ncbi:MAG: peptidoglycan-binding domain-containing protein [Terrimicrobiaceae bacterium]